MNAEKLAEGKRLVEAAKATGLDETSTTRENWEAKRWLLANASDLLAAAEELAWIRRTLQVALNRQGPREDTTLDFVDQLIEEHQEDLAKAQAAEERAQEWHDKWQVASVDADVSGMRLLDAERERDEAKAQLQDRENRLDAIRKAERNLRTAGVQTVAWQAVCDALIGYTRTTECK